MPAPQVKDLGASAPASARAEPEVVHYLGEVVVQDACDLLSDPDPRLRAAAEANLVHKYMLANECFRCAWCACSCKPAWQHDA